jgi:hypothetical protein
MRLLLIVHRGLQAAGHSVAVLAILVMILAGFVVSVLGSLLLCMFGGVGLAYEVDGGTWVGILAFVLLGAFWGNYVWIPHLGPALGRALSAILSEASLGG